MPISFACSGCSKIMKVNDSLAGKKVRCKECDSMTTIPAPRRSSPGPAPTTKSIRTQCPHCNSKLRVPLSKAGKTIACPSCSENLNVPTGTRTRPRPPKPASTKPGPPPPSDDFSFEAGDDDAMDSWDDDQPSDEGAAPRLQARDIYAPPKAKKKKRKKKRSRSGGLAGWLQGDGIWIAAGIAGLGFLIVSAITVLQSPQAPGSGPFLIAGMLCAIPILLVLLAIPTIIFRMATSMIGEEVPGFVRCMAILLLALSVNSVIQLPLNLIVASPDPASQLTVALMLLCLGISISAACYATIFMLTLDVSWLKGLGIWAIMMALLVLIVIVAVLALAALGFVINALR